jgi:hypothetical protein
VELKKRLKAKTPKWFRTIIHIGLMLAAAGLAVKLTAPTIGFNLNVIGNTLCNYFIITGAVAAAVAKTAQEKCVDDEEQ